MKKLLIFLAMIIIILPYNFFMPDKYGFQDFEITYYIPLIIGYILFFIFFITYTKKQKKLMIIALITCLVNVLTSLVPVDVNIIHSWLGILFYFINVIMFFITYFALRILCLIVGIGILKTNKKK